MNPLPETIKTEVISGLINNLKPV